MATGGDLTLTDCEIEDLAQIVVSKHMATIAIKYLGLPHETVENLKIIHQNDYIAFNRVLLILWRNKNPAINQVQNLADMLYAAAEELGNVDPNKVKKILRVQHSKKAPTSAPEETVTEDEFEELAQKFKPHAERKMKIEPLPWLREYFVDMKDNYTELNLQQIKNTLQGESFVPLKSYVEVLVGGSEKGKKILMKAEPGMGKTTLGKKIGLDWAVGIFQAFSIVFFVALKLVKPQQAIEDVIIQQNSELLGLGLSQQKLSSILAKFRDRCLLILDGLDEHGLGQNEDVLEIIRGEKLFGSGIVVFSRPHSAKEIGKYFHTIVRVSGFTESEAEKFVSKIIKDKDRIKEIMKFEPYRATKTEFPIQKCPILLAFLCTLVKDNDIQLSDETITVGDIYFRMMKHLYKKFVIRKGIDFAEDEFVNMMKSVGNLALKTLIENNPLLQRKEVHRIVGECAFEYGFFAGHEDSRLSLDVLSDIFVTYAHGSIEEFFGSFGFIQGLCDGKSVEDIFGPTCKKPIFMMNPLVLKFCLWFLSSSNLLLAEKDSCFDKLAGYVAERIDIECFYSFCVRTEYPAISIDDALNKNDVLELNFFRKTLEKCQCIRSFSLKAVLNLMKPDHIDYMLGSVSSHVLENLIEITTGEYFMRHEKADKDGLIISIDDMRCKEALEYLDIMLNKYNLSRRRPEIYFRIRLNHASQHEMLTDMVPKYVKELHFSNVTEDTKTLMAAGDFPSCPALTHLTLGSFKIDNSVSVALKKAVHCGKLPKLKCINLVNCEMDDSDWHELPEFCFQTGIKDEGEMFTKLEFGPVKSRSNIGTEIKKTAETIYFSEAY